MKKQILKKLPIHVILFLLLNTTLIAQDYTVLNFNSSNGLPQNYINHLIFDKNGQLWIGTNGGLSVFNGLEIKNISHPDLNSRIYSLFQDSHKNIFVIGNNRNIFKHDALTSKLKKQNKNLGESKNWFRPVNQNNNNISDRDHFYHFYSFINESASKKVNRFDKNGVSLTVNLSIQKSFKDSYFLLDTTLILRIKNEWYRYTDKQGYSKIKCDLPQDFKKNGFIFNSENLTFLMYGQSIFKLILKNNHLEYVKILSDLPLDVIKNKIISGEYNSKESIFYLGTVTEGFYVIKPTYFSANRNFREINNKRIYHKNHIFYSQVEIDSNIMLVNNSFFIDNKTGKIINETKNIYGRSPSFKDDKKKVWYCIGNKITIIDDKKERVIYLDSFSNNSIVSISQISNNQFLILSSNAVHLIENYKFIKKINFKGYERIESPSFSYFFPRNKKTYILSTSHIYSLDLFNNHLKRIDSLKKIDYQIMLPLKDDLLFVGTYGQGYYLFNGNKWVSMPLDKNEYLKFAHTALCDANGHVWISTNNGLFRTTLQSMENYFAGKTKDIYYYYYDKSSGFLTNEFNGGCQSPAVKLQDGRFSFSSIDGLVQFDPLKVPALFPNNPIQIVQLSLNGQPQDSIPPHLEISQNIKDIKLEVSTAYYGHPDNLVIQYKIPGYVEAWTDITDQRYIILQNATHGSFNIEIRKRYGFGNDDFDYISYPVTILPYFYQTWWFRILLTILSLFFTYIFLNWYNSYILRKNKKLEHLIDERNKEVIQTNELLREQIKQNDLFQSIFVHDIKSPIRFITSNTALLKDYWNSLESQIKLDQISNIHDSSTKISLFIEETLLWIKIRNRELQVEPITLKLSAIMHECIHFYRESDKILQGDIKVVAKNPQDLHCVNDIMLINTIFRNLLSNSIKYTEKGTITLYCTQPNKDKIIIGCKDQGKGMSAQLIETLLSENYRGNDIREDSFKMGYVIIKDITKLLGGELHIDSKENQGSNVWIEI